MAFGPHATAAFCGGCYWIAGLLDCWIVGLLVGDILTMEMGLAPENPKPVISRKYSKEVYAPHFPSNFLSPIKCWRVGMD